MPEDSLGLEDSQVPGDSPPAPVIVTDSQEPGDSQGPARSSAPETGPVGSSEVDLGTFLDLTRANRDILTDCLKDIEEWQRSGHDNLSELSDELDRLKLLVALCSSKLDQLLLQPPRHSHEYSCALDEMEEKLLGVRRQWRFFRIFMEKACGFPPARDAPAAKRARHDA